MPNASRKRTRRRLVELACICLAVAQIGWFVFPNMQNVRQVEHFARDQILCMDLNSARADEVVFIAVDEKSLTLDHLFPEDIEEAPELAWMQNGFPWPRQIYAAALDRIFGAGARLVILDFIFDQPREGDPELKAALDRHPGKIVLAQNFSVDDQDPSRDFDDIHAMTVPSTTLVEEGADNVPIGYVNFWGDEDGVVRNARYRQTLSDTIGRVPNTGEKVYESLSMVAARLLGADTTHIETSRPLSFRLSDTNRIPTFSFHSLFVPYEWRQFLKSGDVLQDKIVIIGPSATRLHDFHNTPAGRLEGPLLHIHALLAALNDSFYTRAGAVSRNLIVGAAVILAGILTWLFRRRPIAAFFSLLGGVVLYLAIVLVAARVFDYLLFPIQPSLVFLLAGSSCIAWNFAQERRESGRMRSMLDRYVSRNLVREVLDNRDDFLARLGGTRQPVTVFFSDVRGFTSFSESADASEVVEQLNEYLGEMVGVIFRHQGTVDKFMGDGIMAVWGNVVSEGPAVDSARAVRAAMEMQERIAALNVRWEERGLRPFAVGMGLHHGEAVFGNIGSEEKMEPTVIGDTVNLASRVEGLTKKYGVSICVTQSVAELITGQFLLRPVDLVQVVGKSRPVEIFAVLGPGDMPQPDWLKRYAAAVASFRARRFAEAAGEFRTCLSSVPDDKLCSIYLERCERFVVQPPPPDWTGTEVATSK
jgi:Adenylate cyclase, family 3 (some proteins contain HAMP domain)